MPKKKYFQVISGREKSSMNSMTFWVVRHAEREDNINSAWQSRSTLKSDNSPLSKRGQGSLVIILVVDNLDRARK